MADNTKSLQKDNDDDSKEKSDKQSGPSKFQKIRGNHNYRLLFILLLMIIVAVLFVVWEKARIALAVIMITLLAAFGLEITQNDWDLGKLMETKSFNESEVIRDFGGNVLYDKEGNVTTDNTKGKRSDDYNCDDFMKRSDAQAFFEKVGGVENDLNRLDGDKDGQACESLPEK